MPSGVYSALFLFLCLIPVPLLGEQCKPDGLSPCKADCNGTTFDLSLAFDFPLNVSYFIWSPCSGYNCSTRSAMDCAVCQSGYFSCGKMSNPVWVWDVKEKSSADFPNWQIEYTFGDDWRISLFDFIIDETQEEPVVKFVGMSPMLQFNFHVIGKCIGQPSPACKDIYSKRRSNSVISHTEP